MPRYDLTTLDSIAASAKTAKNHADRQPNQGSYNAAWMHGYAEALKNVSQQLSFDKSKQNPTLEPIQDSKHMVTLWARVGMTLHVSRSVYEQLLQTDKGQLLQDIIIGDKGRAFLDGETYFPDLDVNMQLSEREYDLYDTRPLGLSSPYSTMSSTKVNPALNDMIQDASSRSTQNISSDSSFISKDNQEL